MSAILGTSRGASLRRVVAGVGVLCLAACSHSGGAARASAPRSARPSVTLRPASAASGIGSTSAAARSGRSATPAVDPVRASESIRGGRVLRVAIAARSGFRPRAALIYLPPVLHSHPGQQLPVLELLHGTPGQPSDWFTRGNLLATANGFAAAHHGQAPIIVLPDLNGAERTDTECIRTAAGQDVESYLTRDVVDYVRSHYARSVGHRKWWVAGLSEGGLCAAVLALRHPTLYSSFGDLSGLARPIVEHLTPAASDWVLYRGNQQAKVEHDPGWLLTHRRYQGMLAWFACGADDPLVRQAQTQLVAAARAAHLTVHAELRPGRHVWTIWGPELRSLLPWLWAHAPA